MRKISSTTGIMEECELEERQANLSMIEEKARALLARRERRALLRSCNAYVDHRIDVNSFVDSLLHLLSTPSKVKFFLSPSFFSTSCYFYNQKTTCNSTETR